MHWAPFALRLALVSTGRSMLAKMAIIAITTSNSISVKPLSEEEVLALTRHLCCFIKFLCDPLALAGHFAILITIEDDSSYGGMLLTEKGRAESTPKPAQSAKWLPVIICRSEE